MNTSSFYIYNASAGSGKTYSLVKNYLKVLLQSNQREPFKSVLAITFTNKAVAEMKERIIEALKEFSSPNILNSNNDMFLELCKELNINPEELHKKAKDVLYNILKNYAAFDVSTIDKFTQKIIRTFAFDLKIPLNFEVELDTDSILNKAVDNLISRAGTDEDLTKLLIEFAIEKTDDDKSWDVAYDFNKIAKLLVSENDIPHLETLKDKTLDNFAKLKTQLKKELSKTEDLIKELAQKVLTLIEESGLQFDDFSNSYLPKYFTNLYQLNLNLNFGLSWQNKLIEGETLYPKRVLPEIAETIDALQPELSLAFNKTKELVLQHKFLSNFYKNITPLSVLHLINQELNLIKEEDNKLLISEFNTLISAEIKNQPAPFIYERIGEKFKHYFIDEFQDTSKMQWDNLIPLIGNALSSENSSAMIVGDAKQAIYRWRGGKAEQFMDLNNKTKNPFSIPAEIVSLDTNYRSSKAIIEFNNSFFQHLSTFVFSQPEHCDLYQSSAQNVSSNQKGYVDLSFANITKEDDRDEVFPEQVFLKIQQCISDGYNFRDVCVLVRKTKEGIAVANYLNEQGIEIVSSETLALSRSPEVNFIVASLQFLMNPSNNEYKVEVLRFLSSKLEISNKHEFYSERINLSVDDLYKSLSLFGIEFAPNEALQLQIYELVETIIYHFNLAEEADAYVQFFLNFVFNFSKNNSASISDFLVHYQQKREQLKISSSGGNAVQIMTIHKSKGLEFPIVIFPYADLDIYKELEPKVWFSVNEKEFNGFSQTLLSYNKDIAEYNEQGLNIYNEHQAELELDNINLLYVALTRAIERLYIISSINFNTKGELSSHDKKYSGLFIAYLQHLNKWDDNRLVYTFGEKEKVSKISVSDKALIQNRFISIPKKEHQINILTKAGLLWDTPQKEAIEKGNLIHDIMAQIKSSDDIGFTLDSFMSSGTINEEQKEELTVLINSIVEHTKLKGYFSKNITIYNERDIITKNGIILRPDRLAINDKNEVVIIDYKTGKPDNKHSQQLQTYQDAIEDMGFFVSRKILIYLNEPLEVKEV